jgi:hypothetical protein
MPVPDLRTVGENEVLYTFENIDKFTSTKGFTLLRDLSSVQIGGCGAGIVFPDDVQDVLTKLPTRADQIAYEHEYLKSRDIDLKVRSLHVFTSFYSTILQRRRCLPFSKYEKRYKEDVLVMTFSIRIASCLNYMGPCPVYVVFLKA